PVHGHFVGRLPAAHGPVAERYPRARLAPLPGDLSAGYCLFHHGGAKSQHLLDTSRRLFGPFLHPPGTDLAALGPELAGLGLSPDPIRRGCDLALGTVGAALAPGTLVPPDQRPVGTAASLLQLAALPPAFRRHRRLHAPGCIRADRAGAVYLDQP